VTKVVRHHGNKTFTVAVDGLRYKPMEGDEPLAGHVYMIRVAGRGESVRLTTPESMLEG
jgi:hypothetical protein